MASTALKYLFPGWFAIPMGLCGLALAWHRAQPLMGEAAAGVALTIGGLAALVLVVLAVAAALRAARHPEAWSEDLRHPVRHTFVATMPIALILVATTAVALFGASMAAAAAWWLGSVAQLGVTLWVLGRWWQPGSGKPGATGLQWASATPALFIPVVGNVLVPLAGVPLGHPDWSLAQFGIGLGFWPVVGVLIVVRIAVQGLWPERLLPSAFVFVAPPAVVGLSALQLGAPVAAAWALWGLAVFTLAWVALLARRIAALPFGLPHWAMSFPLAAAAALTLRLAGSAGGPMAAAGIALLAVASLVIAALVLGTLRGLRQGTLLQPEPMAVPVAVAAG